MEMFPICNVCRWPFTLRGPSPFLLPCLHDVCEKCVTFSAGGMITCNKCKCDINLSDIQLKKAAATMSQILHLTIKKKPEDLLCTHEDDGNQALYWCQDCEEMLCVFCQKMHQSFKALANHDMRKLADINEDILHKEKYCALHSSYLLDTWDKTCRLVLCSRCSKMQHGDHELEDIGLAAMSRKQRLKSTEIEVRSALTAHIARHSDMCSHKKLVIQETDMVKTEIMKTFSTLRERLDSRQRTLLGKLGQLTGRMLKTISQDIKCSEAMQHKYRATEEYIEKCLKYASKHDIVSFDDKTAWIDSARLVTTPLDKLNLKVPVFNSEALDDLLESINCFSNISEEIVSKSGQYADKGNVQSETSKEVVMEVKAASAVEDVKSEVKPQPQTELANNVTTLGRENNVPHYDNDSKNYEKSSEASTTTTEEAKEEEAVDSKEKKAPVLKYKYKQDQWSPLNPEGKMQYDRDFLLQLQCSKDSMKKPDTLPNFPEIIPDKPTTKPDMGMRSGPGNYRDLPDFTPGFLRPSRGHTPKPDLRMRSEPGDYRDSADFIPGFLRPFRWDLYCKVRSILRKLTPQKFQTLIKQFRRLVIDTETKLKGVTDIFFEEALREQANSVAFANMCRYLSTLNVPSDTKPGESVNFRVLLLTRCQREFETDRDTQLDLDRRKKDIEEATDQKRATEMKEELDQAITNARRRSIGNIRLMGELFKLKMLTETIMHDCVFKLLRSGDEVNLECLCHLLTTIGKELESEKAKPRLDQYFQQLKKIVAEKKVSSRCRFMIQDVIDLRANSWKPRRDENNPETIDQIHKDAKREVVEQDMLTALHIAHQPSQPQHHQSRLNKPARGRPGGQAGGSMEEGWYTVSSSNADGNIQLGPATTFGALGRGGSGGGSKS